jgi:Fanconi anemia group M protein
MQRFKDNPRIKGYYIIHGEWKSIHEYSSITIESILSAIASIQARYNVKAIVVPSRKYAIYMALKIIEKSQDFKNVRPVAYKVDSGDRAVDMLVAAAEGVGINDAINLLNRFGSVKGVINASRDELLEVKKMGKKKVERLKRTINYDRGDDF